MWLPAHLACFAAGMALAVLRSSGHAGAPASTLPSAAALYLIVSTPAGGAIIGPDPAWVPVTKARALRGHRDARGGAAGTRFDRYERMLGSRPMVWLGEISYEIFLLHVVVMAVTMSLVLRWPLFTGSMAGLYGRPRRGDPICVDTSPADQLLAVTSARSAATAPPTPARDATPRPSPPALSSAAVRA